MNGFAIVFFAMFLFVSAAPVSLRDVFVPPIVYPTADTVWKSGSTHTVKWSTANPPKRITNTRGVVMLKKLDGRLDIEHPLAQDFDIMAGEVSITVPHVTPGKSYRLVLFGDSGNDSPSFTIED